MSVSSCLCNSELEKCFCLLMNVHQIWCLISDHVLRLILQVSSSKPSSYCTLGRITFNQGCLSGTLKLGTLLSSKPHEVSYSWSRRNSFTPTYLLNPFQSNFSATRILPSSYLFWAGKRLVDYLSVLHEEKHRTDSDSGAGEQMQQKKCRTSSDIGAEQENHNVGQGRTLDRKGLTQIYIKTKVNKTSCTSH
jgi:hypothetical protein